MTTARRKETVRKAVRTYTKNRVEAGERRMTIWTTPEMRVDLARLKAIHGSNERVIAAALAMAAAAIHKP